MSSREVSDLLMLRAGQMPPPEFSRPEVLEILMDYYQAKTTEE
jgi:ATP sulfurylase